MKMYYKRISVIWISIIGVLSLTGCTSLLSSRMPQGSLSMQQAYNGAIDGTTETGAHTLKHVRAEVNTLGTRIPSQSQYTRTHNNEINALFSPIPNPTIVMYVYPHETGSGYNVSPVPGYSTVFPLYKHVYYAMPGDIQ